MAVLAVTVWPDKLDNATDAIHDVFQLANVKLDLGGAVVGVVFGILGLLLATLRRTARRAESESRNGQPDPCRRYPRTLP